MSEAASHRIPITKPFFDDTEPHHAASTIRSGWIMQGPQVEAFEAAVARFAGSRYAVAVSSGTAALHLALLAAEIGPEDEVIVPSFSFIATANTVCHVGAKPVFVDIDAHTFNLDPDRIESCITGKTKAIVPVHQFGLPCDMDKIQKIAQQHGLVIIEDAACALGSEYRGNRIGSMGALTCFSFHPRKIITTGEGGMITTNEERFAEKLNLLRNHGMSISGYHRHSASQPVRETYVDLGYNYRLTDIQAAIGIIQMRKLGGILEKRKQIASRYDDAFEPMEGLMPPRIPVYAKTNYQSYALRITPDLPNFRDTLVEELSTSGIASKKADMAIHKEACYMDEFGEVYLPITEECAGQTILLPIFPAMTADEQSYIIDRMRRLLFRYNR